MSERVTESTVVYRFTPANEGDFLVGIPARDITVLDAHGLNAEQLRNMLSPGPRGQKPMYTASGADNEQAAAARQTQERMLVPFKAAEQEAARQRAEADAAEKAEREAAKKAADDEAARQKAEAEAAKQQKPS